MSRLAKSVISLAALALIGWAVLWKAAETSSTYQQPGDRNALADDDNRTIKPTVYVPTHFCDGEVSEYKITIKKGIFAAPVGRCSFSAKRVDTNGTVGWRFRLEGGALAGIIRYDATSMVNAAFNHTRKYHTVQKDLASRNVELEFNEANRVCRRTLNGQPGGEVATREHTLDPLSIIFKFREMNLDEPGEFSSAVSDGKATFDAKVTVVGREEIKIGDQTYKAILVEPDLGPMRGIFRKEEGAKLQIWLSDDAHQTALRIKTEIKHGTFTADLENYTRPN